MDQLIMKISKDVLLGRGGGRAAKSPPKAFVAYRMNDRESTRFRDEFESAINSLGRVVVLDGRVDDGETWATEIRKRIRSANIVIADVTGPSKEVIFEIGVCGGKHLLPVVETSEHRSRLPSWLTTIQIPTFEGTGTVQIAESAWERLSSPSLHGKNRRPAAPGKVIWLQNDDSDWCDASFDRFQNLCSERSLAVDRVYPDDLTSAEDLNSILRAWLIVGCIDGGTQDYAAHYFAGDVVSRQMCGTGSGAGQKIRRGMIVLVKDESDLPRFVADSVNRVERSLVSQAPIGNFIDVATNHLARYRRWLKERS